MPIYLDFSNITIRIHTDIPMQFLDAAKGHYPTYWFIKFNNSYGPDTLSGVFI